jgi:putative phosphonate metabolism protein
MRYAIYFAPPENDALSVCAAHWLGRDAFHGRLLAQPAAKGFERTEIAALTDEPRRYGFHATLKAPFELAAGRTEHELLAAIDVFAASTEAFVVPELALGQLGPFFALVPAEENAGLQAFAGACVRHFEPFRAALSEADIARRKPETLGETERRHLMEWGYPYVFETFRFHMTLTGQVPPERREAMRRALQAEFSAFIGRPLAISHLALFVEPERGAPFVVKRISPLRAMSERKTA